MSITKGKESRKIARYSLLVMGIGFVGTIPFQGNVWIDLLQGGFEAGLVGGLADWFAVTALFRHPLGIPIPHTALLPKNRERMTNALVSTVKKDWLSKESIQAKIRQVEFTNLFISKIEKELDTDAFQKGLVKLIKKMIGYIDVEKLTPVVKEQLVATAGKFDMGNILQVFSDHLLKGKFDERVLDHALKKAEKWLRSDETSYRLGAVSMNMLNKIEVDGILQFALNSIRNLLSEEKLGSIVKKLLLNGVHSLQDERDKNREALLDYIRNELKDISANKELLDGIENWKNELIANWEPDQAITKTLSQFQQSTLELIEEESFIDTYLIPLVKHVLENIKEQNNKVDHWIQNQIYILVENNHEQIGHLVQENLDKLDTETLIDMMENNIGKDLQWIRVNGAVCGFIIGIILTGIQTIASIL